MATVQMINSGPLQSRCFEFRQKKSWVRLIPGPLVSVQPLVPESKSPREDQYSRQRRAKLENGMEQRVAGFIQEIVRWIVVDEGKGKEEGQKKLNPLIVNGNGIVDQFLRAVNHRVHQGTVPDGPEGRRSHENPNPPLYQNRPDHHKRQEQGLCPGPVYPGISRPENKGGCAYKKIGDSGNLKVTAQYLAQGIQRTDEDTVEIPLDGEFLEEVERIKDDRGDPLGKNEKPVQKGHLAEGPAGYGLEPVDHREDDPYLAGVIENDGEEEKEKGGLVFHLSPEGGQD